MNSKITINGTEYTLLAIATANSHDGLLVTMRQTPGSKATVQKWVYSDGEFHCVAAVIPFDRVTEDVGWSEDQIRYAAIHGGAWWEDHSAQLEAMAWVGANAYLDDPESIPVQCSRSKPDLIQRNGQWRLRRPRTPMFKRYAIVASDKSGPALGIGTSEQGAWADAEEWCADKEGLDPDGLTCIEITDASYVKILDGNPDAVEEVE